MSGQAVLAFNRVYKPSLEPLGLTCPHYLVMVALRKAEGQTVSEPGEHLFLESGMLTPLQRAISGRPSLKKHDAAAQFTARAMRLNEV